MNQNLIVLIFLLLFGIFLRRLKKLPDNTAICLNLFIIYVSLPAVILLQIPKLIINNSLIVPIITPWMILIISAGLVLLMSRFVTLKKSTIGALLLIIPLGNTSFLGLPMVESFFGKSYLPYAIVYDQLGSFLALGTYGTLIVSYYSSSEKFCVKSFLKRIFTFPPFLCLIFAFCLRGVEYASYVDHTLKLLGNTLIPLALISVGFQLNLKLSLKDYGTLSWALGIKLLIAPAIVLMTFKLFQVESDAGMISVFESGMPPMITAAAVAISNKLDPDLTAAIVGVGIFLSFLSLPLLHFVITN
jgi:predicted permease